MTFYQGKYVVSAPDPKAVKIHFDDRSKTYSDLFQDSTRSGAARRFQRRQQIVAELCSNKHGRLLDCATGTGEVTLAALLSGTFDSAVINDLSTEMLLRSRRLLESSAEFKGNLEFVNSSVFELSDSISPGSCDLILCVGLIAHVGDLDGLMGMFRSLLSEDGHLLFQTTLLDHVGVRITRRLSERRHIRKNGYAIKHYWHADVVEACSRNGLSATACRRGGLDIPFLDRVAPRIGHFIEDRFAHWMERSGSEAIYVLTRSNCSTAEVS